MKANRVMRIVASTLLLVVTQICRSEEDYDPGKLAGALSQASVSLDHGLKESEREGRPISAKYEIENGTLQLSVYTRKGDQFHEVIVDHKSGAIKNTEPITEADDMRDAKEQSAALAKATVPLDAAVRSAVKSNSGYRAVSIVPSTSEGRPFATITLMKGKDVKRVIERLN